MKRIITAISAIIAALALSSCATDPDTICFDDWIYARDVYGTGLYTEYREEFENRTGCTSLINCEGRMKIRRCVENVEFR